MFMKFGSIYSMPDTSWNETQMIKSCDIGYCHRHPDIVVRAYKVYVCLGCIILVEVIGIYSEIGYGLNNIVFWVLALVAYLLASITIAYILYHSGKFSLDSGVFKGMCKSSFNLVVRQKYSSSREFLSVKFCVKNVLWHCTC